MCIAMSEAEIKMRAFENQRKKYFLNPKCTSSEMPTNLRPAFNIG